MANKKIDYKTLDLKLIEFFRRTFEPVARASVFIVFFWFGYLKLTGTSPAGPLARELINKTVGLQYFHTLFITLAALECIIGILFLFPKATRIVIPLLLVHMILVCSPLLLVTNYTWQQPFVPTLEGQYIIKNAVVIAVAIGIAASTSPLKRKK